MKLTKTEARILEHIVNDLGHIKKPYTLEEILSLYYGHEYNAELLLQHLFLLLAKSCGTSPKCGWGVMVGGAEGKWRYCEREKGHAGLHKTKYCGKVVRYE